VGDAETVRKNRRVGDAETRRRALASLPPTLPLLIAVCCILLLFPGCRAALTTEDDSPIIAEVGTLKLRRAAFHRFVKSRMGDLPSNNLSDELYSQFLDEFIKRKAISLEAGQKGITITSEEISRMLAGSSNAAVENGSSPDETRAQEEIIEDLLIAKYHHQVVLRDVKVTQDEIAQHYEKSAALYQREGGFYVREIRVDTAEKAAELHRQVTQERRDFASVARSSSQAANAEQGGLSYYERGQLPTVLEGAILNLSRGAISPVIQSNFGYHIFKLERMAEPLTLERASEQIREELIRQKSQALVEADTERLIAKVRIKINSAQLGFNYVGRFGNS